MVVALQFPLLSLQTLLFSYYISTTIRGRGIAAALSLEHFVAIEAEYKELSLKAVSLFCALSFHFSPPYSLL